PLVTGVFARYRAPDFARALLRPVEVTSEALGAVSFVFVTATQFRSIMNLGWRAWLRSEEHTSELQSRGHLVCRLLLEKKKHQIQQHINRISQMTHLDRAI